MYTQIAIKWSLQSYEASDKFESIEYIYHVCYICIFYVSIRLSAVTGTDL